MKSKNFSFLWITNSWATLDHSRDTTLRLAEEALVLGAKNFWCDFKSIRFENGKPWMDAAKIEEIGSNRARTSFDLGLPASYSPSTFSSIQYRVDPPVDLAYLQPLQILLLDPRVGKKITNPPEMIFQANEKLEGMLLPGMLPTMVSSEWERLLEFGKKERRTVLKPLHLAQSQGVELLSWKKDSEISSARHLIGKATDQFSRPVLLQRFLPEIKSGETRLWFLDGKPIGHIRKLPLKGDFRVNLDRGSSLVSTRLTSREQSAAGKIGKHLGERKVRLAAVDLIDGYITDFNFTSPGLLVEMEQILGVNLARKVIEAFIQKKI